MSSAYYRLKKYRQLKRVVEEVHSSSDSLDAKKCRFQNVDFSLSVPMENASYHDSDDDLRDDADELIDSSHDNNDNQSNGSNSSFEYSNRSPDYSSADSQTRLSSSSQNSLNSDASLSPGIVDNVANAVAPSFRDKLQE